MFIVYHVCFIHFNPLWPTAHVETFEFHGNNSFFDEDLLIPSESTRYPPGEELLGDLLREQDAAGTCPENVSSLKVWFDCRLPEGSIGDIS